MVAQGLRIAEDAVTIMSWVDCRRFLAPLTDYSSLFRLYIISLVLLHDSAFSHLHGSVETVIYKFDRPENHSIVVTMEQVKYLPHSYIYLILYPTMQFIAILSIALLMPAYSLQK